MTWYNISAYLSLLFFCFNTRCVYCQLSLIIYVKPGRRKNMICISEGFLVRSCNATMSLPFGTQSKNQCVWPTRIQGLVCRSNCDKRYSTSIWQCRKVNCYISVLNQRKKNYSIYMFGQKYHSCTIKGNQIISSFICKDRKLKLKDGLLLKNK